MPTHDWTPPNATFTIDYKLYHKKTIASVAAISLEGPELIMNFPKSINSARYCEFLRALRKKLPERRLVIFCDQLQVHFSKETTPVLRELNISVIKNAAYSPNFNPIEGAISVCKTKIKRARLRSVVLRQELNLEETITKSFMEIGKKVCVNFI